MVVEFTKPQDFILEIEDRSELVRDKIVRCRIDQVWHNEEMSGYDLVLHLTAVIDTSSSSELLSFAQSYEHRKEDKLWEEVNVHVERLMAVCEEKGLDVRTGKIELI